MKPGAGVCDETAIKRALAVQQMGGGRLGAILVNLKLCTESQIRTALSQQMGIEVVDSEQKFREKGEGDEGAELDLTPGALDKTNDPVRMYLREMGTVPLLDREGEVEIAQRIEQGEWLMYEALCENPVVLRELRGFGLLAMSSFFIVLGGGYLYARSRGALKWR